MTDKIILEIDSSSIFKRYINSLFPNLWSFFLFFLLAFGLINLLKSNLPDNALWSILFFYILLLIYFVIIKPLIEAKIYITTIKLNEKQKTITFEFLEFNSFKQLTCKIEDLKYIIFNSSGRGIELTNRIIFYNNDSKFLTQYSVLDWNLEKINEIGEILNKTGVKKTLWA